MTSHPITASATRTLGGCLHCATGAAHDRHDTTLPAVQRSSITATRKKTTR